MDDLLGDTRLYRFKILANHERDTGAFAGGGSDLFGAALAQIASGKDTRHAGFQEHGFTVFKPGNHLPAMHQVVLGLHKALRILSAL
jgi:hypothetical protein